MRVSRLGLIIAFGVTFGVGVFLGSGRIPFSTSLSSEAEAIEHSGSVKHENGDTLKLGASGAVRSMASSHEANAPHFDLFNEKTRASMEAYLREVPFTVLKQIYYERQDAEFDKVNERYSSGKELNEADLARRTEELTTAYLRASEGSENFYAESEWKLRGGRTTPVKVFAKFYTTEPSSNPGGVPVGGSASEARNGRELCWTVSLYVKGAEKFSMESTSTCLNWTSIREGVPYAVLQAYSKNLIPYFDSASVPLPGFGSDAGANPEWFDSNLNRWTGLAALHWEPRERSEIVRLEKELQAETAW